MDGGSSPATSRSTATSVGRSACPAAGGRIAAPGLVDIQVNGFAGVDLMAADADELHALARALPRYGVTAWLPTLITAAATDTDRALDRLGEAFRARQPSVRRGAEPGVHLRARTCRRGGSAPILRSIAGTPTWRAGRWRRRGDVVAVTLAPELPGMRSTW